MDIPSCFLVSSMQLSGTFVRVVVVVCRGDAGMLVSTAYTRLSSKHWDKELCGLVDYKNASSSSLPGYNPSGDSIEGLSPAPPIANDTEDDQIPTSPAMIPRQTQMDDQTPYQVDMEDRVPTDPVQVPTQVQIDDLEDAIGTQMAITPASPEKAALIKRLRDLVMKHEEITVC